MAFLGIRIPHEYGRLLSSIDVPGQKISTSDLHITLLCFKDNLEISEIAKTLEVTYNVVSKFKPFLIKTDAISCFPKYEDNPVAIMALVDSDEIHKLHDQLKKEFDENNLSYNKTFKKYIPHITLSYSKEEIKKFTIDKFEFCISEIVLWGGDHGDDRVFVTFPLKSPEKHKHASLEAKVNLFYKLSTQNTEIFYRAQPKGKDIFHHQSGLAYEKVPGIFAFEKPDKIFETYSWLHMRKNINDYEMIIFKGELIERPEDSEGVVVKPEQIISKIPLIDFAAYYHH
jgi:2'-5' RNA ligase